MAAYEFPDAPLLGDEHTHTDGIVWVCENETGPIWGPKLTNEQLKALDIDLEDGSVIDVKIYIPSIHDTIYDNWITENNINFPEISAFVLESNLLSIYDMVTDTPVLIKTLLVINGVQLEILDSDIYVASSTTGITIFSIKENYADTLLQHSTYDSLAIRKFDIRSLSPGLVVAAGDKLYVKYDTYITGYTDGAHEAAFLSNDLFMGSTDARRLAIGIIDDTDKLITDPSFVNFTESSVPAILQGAGWVKHLTRIEDRYLVAAITNPPALMHLWVDYEVQHLSDVLHLTHEYFTGIMHGNCIGAYLANSVTADRSAKNNGLTEIGTLIEAPITVGSDIMCYSGFTANDYVIQAYNADYDINFDHYDDDDAYCIDIWVYRSEINTDFEFLFCKADADGSPVMRMYISTGNKYTFNIDGITLTSYNTAAINKWELVQISVTMNSNSWAAMHVNGHMEEEKFLEPSYANIVSQDSSGKFTIGRNYQESSNAYPFSGSLALLRVSTGKRDIDMYTATGSVAYELEKLMFNNEGVKTLIQDDNSNIKYIDYDEDGNKLDVITDNSITKYTKTIVIDSRDEAVDSISSVTDKELTGIL